MLERDFFSRPTQRVAQDLVGCALVCGSGESTVVAQIVEVEAYLGENDPASHAWRGRTARSAIMFGQPGHLYVYLSYGIHCCANVVTESDGVAGAVLFRAAAVESGEEVVRTRRTHGNHPIAHDKLLSGPGNFCKGLNIDRSMNGRDVCSLSTGIYFVDRETAPPISTHSRIGISRAVDQPLRYVWTGHSAVSRR